VCVDLLSLTSTMYGWQLLNIFFLINLSKHVEWKSKGSELQKTCEGKSFTFITSKSLFLLGILQYYVLHDERIYEIVMQCNQCRNKALFTIIS